MRGYCWNYQRLDTWRESVHILMDANQGCWSKESALHPNIEAFFDDVFREGCAGLMEYLQVHVPRCLGGLITEYVRGAHWAAKSDKEDVLDIPL